MDAVKNAVKEKEVRVLVDAETVKEGFISVHFDERGFGYIREIGTPVLTTWFYHISDCLCMPEKGLRVQFKVGKGKKGPAALCVREAVGGAA